MDSLTPASRLPTDMELQGRREGVVGWVCWGGEEGERGEGRREEGGGGEGGGVQYNYYSQKMGGQFPH